MYTQASFEKENNLFVNIYFRHSMRAMQKMSVHYSSMDLMKLILLVDVYSIDPQEYFQFVSMVQ